MSSTNKTDDCSVLDAVRVFFDLDPEPKITTQFEQDHNRGYWYVDDNNQRVYKKGKGFWYKNQKEHVISWFITRPTSGIKCAGKSYHRFIDYNTIDLEKCHCSAKRIYNDFKNPCAVLWIAEALGVDENIVEKAAKAVTQITIKNSKTKKGYKYSGNIIQNKYIPWELVIQKINEHIDGKGIPRVEACKDYKCSNF